MESSGGGGGEAGAGRDGRNEDGWMPGKLPSHQVLRVYFPEEPCAFSNEGLVIYRAPSDLRVMNSLILARSFCSLGGVLSAETKGSHGAVPLLPWVPHPHHSRLPVSE